MLKFRGKTNRRPSTAVLIVPLCTFVLTACSKVAHQRPYRWDAFALPEQHFTNATITEVVSIVNATVAKASSGSVTQAVFLDTTPAGIIVYPFDTALKGDMEELVEDFRRDETNRVSRGACGFETLRYTGAFMARHSLACELREVAEWAQLEYQEKPDAIHLGRNPTRLECRAYKISSGLKQMAEELEKQNQVRVDTEPVISAFIDVTSVHLWSIDVPTAANEITGEFRYANVFKFLPEQSVLLVIETQDAHVTATKNLKDKGYWESIPEQ